jgi:putative membrane protein
MMGYGYGAAGWPYIFMMGSSILFWVLLALGVIALVRYLGGDRRQVPRPTPEQMLAERFARGEIDDGEYTRRLDTLRQDASGDAAPGTVDGARSGASADGG